MKAVIKRAYQIYDKFMPAFIILALVAGIFAAMYFPAVRSVSNKIMAVIIDSITLIAPIAIFIILAPSVASILNTRRKTKFGGFVVGWFTLTRFLAGAWSVLFVTLVLGLPIISSVATQSFGDILYANLKVLLDLLTKSTTLIAIYVSIGVGLCSYFIRSLERVFQKLASGIEVMGNYVEPLTPLLMFLTGAYIHSLPYVLMEEVGNEAMSTITSGSGITILGNHINIASQFGLIYIYLFNVALVALGCFTWQFMQIILVKIRMRDFSIKRYFKEYWIRIYPLAWSTSSEAASMPLNVSLVKRAYPEVNEDVRRLTCGLGAYLNINGTTMSVLVLTGIVCALCGVDVSMLTFLLALPIIVIIGYGVPGIPAELIFYALPMMAVTAVPEAIAPVFLAIFLAVQIGLPDSFRTGTNVTDNGLYAVVLNEVYNKRYAPTTVGEEARHKYRYGLVAHGFQYIKKANKKARWILKAEGWK